MTYQARTRRKFGVLLIATLLGLAHTIGALSAEETDWDRWGVNNPAQTHVPDHTGLSIFLKKFGIEEKDEVALAYVAMKGNGIVFLDDYIGYLQRLPVSKLNRREQLAYWLNLYNAGVIRVIASERKSPVA